MSCQRCGRANVAGLCSACRFETQADQRVAPDEASTTVEAENGGRSGVGGETAPAGLVTVEQVGVPADEGESFAEAAARLREEYPNTFREETND